MPSRVCRSAGGREVSAVRSPVHFDECVSNASIPLLRCTLTAERGRKIGWTPQFAPNHIVETAAEEVQLIVDNLQK